MPDQTLIDKTKALFKQVYLPVMQSQINESTVLAANLERTTEDVDIGPPATAEVVLQTGRNPGIGARGVRDTLPTAGNARHARATIALTNLYGSMYIPGPYLEVKEKAATYGSFLARETKALINSLKIDYNRQLNGDGTGVLADCGAMAAPGNVIPVTQTKFFFVDQVVDILVKASGVELAKARTITAVDPVGLTITIDGAAIQTATTHSVYITGNRNLEIDGILAMISNADPPKGAYQGLPVATNPFWKAVMTPAGGAAPSEDLWQKHEDQIDVQSGRGRVKRLIITTHAIRRKFFAALKTDRRFVEETETLRGGFKAVLWNENVVHAEKDAVAGRTDFIDLEMVREYQMSDWDLMRVSGSELIPDSMRTHGYEVRPFKIANLGCHYRAAHGAITGQSEA